MSNVSRHILVRIVGVKQGTVEGWVVGVEASGMVMQLYGVKILEGKQGIVREGMGEVHDQTLEGLLHTTASPCGHMRG